MRQIGAPYIVAGTENSTIDCRRYDRYCRLATNEEVAAYLGMIPEWTSLLPSLCCHVGCCMRCCCPARCRSETIRRRSDSGGYKMSGKVQLVVN
jgi:hypothetical protein